MKKITRRSFSKMSAGAAAAMAGIKGTSAAIRTSPVSPNDRLTVGLIGAGGMGMGDLRDMLRIPEVDCLALADVDTRRVEKNRSAVEKIRGKKPEGYQDFRRIIERKDIDMVIVGTPDHWHALPTVLACQEGKDVYCEKPLATTIAEGRVMVKAAEKYGRIVQVGTQQRSAGHFRDAVEFVQSGKLGKIRHVRAWAYIDWTGAVGNPPDEKPPAAVDYDMWLGPAEKRPFNPARFHFTFRWFWDYSGGLMTDWGAHMVDVVMWAMKEDPVGAMATGGKYAYPDDIMETPDTQQSIVEFPSFSMTWEHMLGCGQGPWQREHGCEFHGEDGILVVDRGGWEVHPETSSDGKPRFYKMTPVPRQGASSDYHFAHVKDFVDCVKSRKQPVANVALHHKSVNACHLANIAARLRTQIKWDAATETATGHPDVGKYVGREYRAPWKLPKI